jgi:hypothetical protein
MVVRYVPLSSIFLLNIDDDGPFAGSITDALVNYLSYAYLMAYIRSLIVNLGYPDTVVLVG